MSALRLEGLDGANPLGLLAALGVLRVLDDRLGPEAAPRPALAWVSEGAWRPVLHGAGSLEAVLDAIVADLETWAREPVLDLAYAKGPDRRVEPSASGAIRDVKAPPEVQRALYEEAATSAAEGRRRSARMLVALGTELAVDNNGYAKPTALHFTAGQQQFLAMAAQLREGVRREDFRSALLEPWDFASKLPSFSWNATGQRLWAYRASNPSGEKRGSCPGAEWLALVGLSFFACAPAQGFRGPQTLTTGVRGGWKDSELTWPLWTRPATARTVESLLRLPELAGMPAHERAARGIGAVLRSAILRSDQGGYGSFTPPKVL